MESVPFHGEIIGVISRWGLSFIPLNDTKSVKRSLIPSLLDISSFWSDNQTGHPSLRATPSIASRGCPVI
jgi:hypothetical protein